MNTNFYFENLKRRDNLGDLGINGMIILKYILRKQGVMVWTVVNWLWTGSTLLWMW